MGTGSFARAGASFVRLAAFAVAVSACERGCAQRAPLAPDAGGTDLSGTDCSDGTVRCVEGRVEASRFAHVPYPCGGIREGRAACECPWDFVTACAHGCAAPGVVAIAGPDAGARQLCQPDREVARPALPADLAAASLPAVCAEGSTVCRDGLVVACDAAGRPPRVLAACAQGCALDIALEHGESVIANGLTAILCRRDQPERR